jgi:hypothetical protein
VFISKSERTFGPGVPHVLGPASMMLPPELELLPLPLPLPELELPPPLPLLDEPLPPPLLEVVPPLPDPLLDPLPVPLLAPLLFPPPPLPLLLLVPPLPLLLLVPPLPLLLLLSPGGPLSPGCWLAHAAAKGRAMTATRRQVSVEERRIAKASRMIESGGRISGRSSGEQVTSAGSRRPFETDRRSTMAVCTGRSVSVRSAHQKASNVLSGTERSQTNPLPDSVYQASIPCDPCARSWIASTAFIAESRSSSSTAD